MRERGAKFEKKAFLIFCDLHFSAPCYFTKLKRDA